MKENSGAYYRDRDVSPEGLELIKYFEGFRADAYRCPAGVWTIGYGHTKGVKPTDKIDKKTAVALLAEDIVPIENALNDWCEDKHIYLEQCEFDALVSFGYNCGTNAMIKVLNGCLTEYLDNHINYGYMEHVIDDIVIGILSKYVNAGGVKLNGLIRRRTAECTVFKHGWGNEGTEFCVSFPCKIDLSRVVLSPTMVNITFDISKSLNDIYIYGTYYMYMDCSWMPIDCGGVRCYVEIQ